MARWGANFFPISELEANDRAHSAVRLRGARRREAEGQKTANKVDEARQKLAQLLREKLDEMARETVGETADPSAIQEARRALSKRIQDEVFFHPEGPDKETPTIVELANRAKRMPRFVREVVADGATL